MGDTGRTASDPADSDAADRPVSGVDYCWGSNWDIPVNTASMTAAIDEHDSAYCFAPLESGFNILVGQVPAALVTFGTAVAMDRPQEILFFTESGMLGPDNTSGVYLNPVTIGDMIDRSYAGYQEVPLVAPEPVDGREVLVGVSFAALPAEIAD